MGKIAAHADPLNHGIDRRSGGVGTAGYKFGLPLHPADWSGLSLVVGISLAESLDPLNGSSRRIGLKWPNDLWLEGPGGEHKLAGILVETASVEGLRYVVIGVGINIRAAAFRYYTSVDTTAFWRAVTRDGTGASATISTTTFPITFGTAYQMNIDCSVGVDCKFYINGILVATHTTALPASGQTMGYAARVTNLLSTARNIRWTRLSITHK